MAGDWIPIQTNLSRQSEVIRIAAATGLSRLEVVGALVEFWGWCDSQTEDGHLPGLTLQTLAELWHQPVGAATKRRQNGDKMATTWRHDGDMMATLLDAMVSVGWLVEFDGSLLVPHFERWMGKSAKRRLQKNLSKRQGRMLGRQDGDKMATSHVAKVSPREEKRTLSNTPLIPQGGEEAGDQGQEEFAGGQTLDEVRAAGLCREASSGVRDTMSDHPELHPVVKRVAEHYRKTVPGAPAPRPLDNGPILALLLAGHGEEKLKGAADCYGRDQRGTDRRSQACRTFYGASGSYSHYAERHGENSAPKPPTFKPSGKRLGEPLSVVEARRKAEQERKA